MSADNYFLPSAANEADLSDWRPIAPAGAKPFATNLFGDAFFVDGSGAVHMLSRAGASSEQVSPSIDQFRTSLQGDPEGWQLRKLADACAASGKILGDGECYAFATPPFLGGDYSVDNVFVCSWTEWFALTADLYLQTRDLPDGAQVRLNIGSDPARGQTAGGFFKRLFR